MFNKLIGRGKVEVRACQITSPTTGLPLPAIYVGVREKWFDWKVTIVDIISFLLISEKLAEHKEGDFNFEKDLDGTVITFSIPSWAVMSIQQRIAELAPKVYEGMQKADEKLFSELKRVKDKISQEEYNELASNLPSIVEKYKQLHAKVNGYTYVAPARAANDDNKNKTVLHQYYFPRNLI